MKPLNQDGKRIIDEASAADLPSPEREAEIWQALSRRFGEPLPPSAARASDALGATGTATGLTGKLVLGGAVLALLVVTGLIWRSILEVPLPADPPPRAATPAESSSAVAAEPAARPERQPAPSAQAPSSLSEETRLIAAAEQALNAGAPGRALALLDQHGARYRHGALAEEREAARILTLCALGRGAEAGRARQHFLRDWPSSPLIARVRGACPAIREDPR